MNIETKQSAADRLREGLQQFYGSTSFFQHPLNRNVVYTEGVQYFAETAGAYWFLDTLATEPAILKEAMEFVHVYLTVQDDGTATITANDGGRHGNDPVDIFARQLDFTDCPPGRWEFFFENLTIMLPRER